MSGSENRILIDTNIIIYHLNGDSTLEALLAGKEIFISFISEIELRSAKTLTPQSERIIERFLSHVITVHSNDRITLQAAELRRNKTVKNTGRNYRCHGQFSRHPACYCR